ncbi:hypothetical protein Q4575_07695 [Psychrosphaera sp. 1_MG-2023]|uniref:ATP-grasp domain-containing protein n=1 Tax=Psychrosphaera sp. 1_MG-2023 TaxID=3062643 RepID=UPI0026E31936|nr:hypothetical protein [Psychrosphaera sp. 1_MG-2023]MDO6719276.1 hypothetical protein [Psychrosphaera sp. 1_MG-2023]
MKYCAILSMDSLEDFEAYDHLIEPHLLARGWQTSTVSWRKKNVDWSQYDIVLIRTPWDYQEDADAFLAVLTDIEQSTARLENSFEMVKWNIDKIYLQQLEQQGVPLVPTIWQSRLGNNAINQAQLDSWFSESGSEQMVLKPRISANSDNTFWLKKSESCYDFEQLNSAFSERDFMIQPFVPAVIEEGEYSLFYFNGEYSHAILKTPKDEDFRVQEEHGGRLKLITPEAKLIASADHCMFAIKQTHEMPLYARLDLIRFKNDFVLMEAEMIEPSLYFNMEPASAERFADAFVTRMTALLS